MRFNGALQLALTRMPYRLGNRDAAAPKAVGITAVTLSMFAFLTGSAQFTASIALLPIAFTLAILCLYRAAWRTAAFALYWTAAAVIVSPVNGNLPLQTEYWLVALGLAGAVFGSVLYANYRHTKSVAGHDAAAEP